MALTKLSDPSDLGQSVPRSRTRGPHLHPLLFPAALAMIGLGCTPSPDSPSNSTQPVTSTVVGLTAEARPLKPGPSNTGVPVGTPLRPTKGPITVSVDGIIIDSWDLTGTLRIEADRVTVRRSRITAGAYYGILVGEDARGTIIEDVEINGQPGCAAGIGFEHYTARRVNMHGCEDGFKSGDYTIIESSWIHDMAATADSHNDGIQVGGGSGLVVRGNNFERPGTNACLFLAPDFSPITNATIEDNWFSGPTTWLLRIQGQPIIGVRVASNRFSRDFTYGPAVIETPIDDTGNMWDDSGELLRL